MSNFKGSTGIWWASSGDIMHNIHGKVAKVHRQREFDDYIFDANVKLLVDAGNVRQQIDVDLPELLAQRNEYKNVLESIMNMSHDEGRSGCTYGDTEMSSTDVCYGYNTALDNIKNFISKKIKQ